MRLTPLRSMIALVLGAAVLASFPVSGAPVSAAAEPSAQPSVQPTASRAAGASSALTVELTDESTGVGLVAGAVGGGLLRPDEGLRVNAGIVNERSAALEDAIVNVHLARARSTSAAALNTWFATGENAEPTMHLASSAPIDIAPRSTATVAIELPPEALSFSEPGAYQLTVTVTAAEIELARSNSAIVWTPDAVAPVSVAIVAPITVPYAPSGLVDAADLEFATGENGLLAQRLQSVIGRPITIATDPMVAASIRALGEAAPESAREWLLRLGSATNDSFALPYADTDQTAALQAAGALPTPSGFDFAFDPADFPTRENSDGEPEPLLPTTAEMLAVPDSLGRIAWPRIGTVTAENLAQLRTADYPLTMLSSSDVQGEGTAAVVTIDGGPVIIAHAELGALLDATIDATTDTEWSRNASRLLGALATTALRTPGRTVVVTIDPPGTTALASRLAATIDLLGAQPWTSLSPLTPVLVDAATAPVATLVEGAQPTDRLELVNRLIAAEHHDSLIATATADPSRLVDRRRLELLAVLNRSLADQPEAWSTAAAAFLDESEVIANAVHVAERGQILVLADRTQLPITLQNDLDQVAIVTVETRALTAGLAIEQARIEVTIEPQSQRNVQVPVQSVSNGAVTVVVSLTSAAGVAVGHPVSLRVNVQAGWETAGFIVVMSLVLLVFIVGVVRTVLRRRRGSTDGDADTDTDAAEATGDSESAPDAASAGASNAAPAQPNDTSGGPQVERDV